MAGIKRAFIVMLFITLFTTVLIVTPLSIYAADECDATISQGGLIHIPAVRYIDNLFTLDLQYQGTSGSGIELTVENIQAPVQDCPVESEITSLSPFTLEIVSLVIGTDNFDITLSDTSGLKINTFRLSDSFNKPYDADSFNARIGNNRALWTGSDGKIHLISTITRYTKNSDVFKGKSECTRNLDVVYPGGTAYATAKGRNVTFTRDATVSVSDTGYLAYKVSGGNLSYKAYESYHGLTALETASTSAMSSSTGNIKMGLLSSEATGTGTLNFERTGTVATSVATCNYSGTAYAEWLYIPSIVFSSSTKSMVEVMRTGRYIELMKMPGGPCGNGGTCQNMRTWNCTTSHGGTIDIPTPDFAWLQGDLTCTWSFKYYP